MGKNGPPITGRSKKKSSHDRLPPSLRVRRDDSPQTSSQGPKQPHRPKRPPPLLLRLSRMSLESKRALVGQRRAKESGSSTSMSDVDGGIQGFFSSPEETLSTDSHGALQEAAGSKPLLCAYNKDTVITNGDTLRDIDGRNKLEYFATTCWIAAEHALQHARSKMSSVSEVFSRWKIPESQYIVLAGFDESLIKSDIGYLEQIHVFVSAEVDTNSALLSELGRIFSPFSSILFTESSSHHIPVFKDDGSVWEFNELVHFTASKFLDGGSSTKMPQTVISLSQDPSPADGFSQGGSGSGEREKKEERRSRKGKERNRGDGDEDGGDKGDKNDKDQGDPEGPSGDGGRAIVELPKISFEIVSEIYPIPTAEKEFQTLTMQGTLAIQTMPLAPQTPHRFSKRHVEFTELTFSTERTTGLDDAYKQFHVRIVVNSQQENASVEFRKPRRTQESDGEEKRLSSTKTGRARGTTVALNLGPHPQGTIAGTAMKTNEETVGSEKNRYTSRITEQHKKGVIRWGFDVDDFNEQEEGIDMTDDLLPAVHFEFVGKFDEPPPPPERMDILVLSDWSMILPSGRKENWLRKLFHFFKSSGNAQMPSYSNLFQILVLETVPSDLPTRSDYRATLHVSTGAAKSDYAYEVEVGLPTDDSVGMKPAVIGDLQKLRKLNIPTFAELILSNHCRQSQQNPDSGSKSH